MNRLTARDKHGHAYYPKCFEHPCDGERSCCTYVAPECTFEGKVLDRLAAYEDTGLGPEQIHRWIPVSERLPSVFESVQITAMMEGDSEPLVYEGTFMGSGRWQLYGVQNPDDYKVSAWMPLPEPYREG